MTILLAALLALQADDKKDLKPVVAKMDKLKSYRCVVTLDVGGEKSVMEGEYVDGTLHLRGPKSEIAQRGEKTLVKPKDGEWKEAKRGKDMKAPHEAVAKLADMVPVLKKEKSDHISGVTVDVYAYSLGADGARKAYEESGAGIASAFAESFVDWTKTKNGILFYVGRNDDLFYRVQQRFQGRTKGAKELDNSVTIEFSRFNAAKLSLPKEILDQLKE
jgi:hypothetical protein